MVVKKRSRLTFPAITRAGQGSSEDCFRDVIVIQKCERAPSNAMESFPDKACGPDPARVHSPLCDNAALRGRDHGRPRRGANRPE